MQVCSIIAKNYAPQARVLAQSLERFHPDVTFHLLVIDEVAGYLDDADEPFELVDPHAIGLPDFERMAGIYDLLELSTAVKPWLLETLLRRSDGDGVVYLDPDMRLYGPLDDVFAAVAEHGLVLNPHTIDPMPRDGRRPNEQDILIAGAYNLGFIGLGPGEATDHLLGWWSERLETECIVDPSRGFFVDQRWIDLVPGMVDDFHLVRDLGFNVAYWNLPSREIARDEHGEWTAGGVPLRLFHFSGFDARSPHLLSKHQDRIELSSHPDLAELCRLYAQELLDAGADETADWPYTYATSASGARLNRTVRDLYRAAVVEEGFQGSLFDPDGEREFLALLNAPAEHGGEFGVTRYLEALWHQRLDLQRAYPRMDAEGAAGFIGWARVFGIGEVPESLRPAEREDAALGVAEATDADAPELPSRNPPFGVNVAGYLTAELGVGEIARQAITALDHATIPVLPVAVAAPMSRQQHAFAAVPPPQRAFPVNLLCVNADMLPGLVDALGPRFFDGRYTIGWWWWEVERFPERWLGSFDHLDELWTGSAFVQEVLSAVSPVPVVRIPVPVSLPGATAPDRAGLSLPDGPLFLFMFDHHSVFERKNPLGVLDAFVRAFPEPGDATLVIKSINAEHHRGDSERLRLAAAPHEHVIVREDYLTASEKRRLLASCDAYVSLHRSEGFGMTMAEAMLLGKPVIATDYSGNRDYMTPENGFLVRSAPRPIGAGVDPYPADAEWAEPDLDHAAELMRALVADPEAARQTGERAALDIQRTNGVPAAARAMEERLNVVRGRLPALPHDYLWAAGEHSRKTHALVDVGAQPHGRRRFGRAARAVRRGVLRVMRPYTVHADRIDREVAVALSDLVAEVSALRAAAARQLDAEAATLRELRLLEGRLRGSLEPPLAASQARIDDLARQLDVLRSAVRQQQMLGSHSRSARGRSYLDSPEVPWSEENGEAPDGVALEDDALSECSRIAIISSPRCGNTWLRRLLAEALGAEELAFHRPGDVPWDDLPGDTVLQLHWPHTFAFRSRLSRAGFQVVTLARHPFDVLISILHYARHEPDTARWLDGAFGDERALHQATPLDEAFSAYATSERARALLAVTADWWDRPSVTSLRYEDLVADPHGELARLVRPSSPLDRILPANDLAAMRAESVNYQVWQGRPGLWRRLLPPEVVATLTRAHAPLLDRLGYDAEPDPALTPDEALGRWTALARPPTVAQR